MTNKIDLNNDKNAILCRALKKHPCLYDRENQGYNKREAYDEAWTTIAVDCSDTVASCKSRWRNIKEIFVRSVRGTPKKRGANRSKDYYLHDLLAFYTPHMNETQDESLELSIACDNDTDYLVKEKDSKKQKANQPNKNDSTIVVDNENTMNTKPTDTKHDTYIVSKKSTKDSTLIIKKAPEKVHSNIVTNSNDTSTDDLDSSIKQTDNEVEDEGPRSYLRRNCRRTLDKSATSNEQNKKEAEPKKPKTTKTGAIKRSYASRRTICHEKLPQEMYIMEDADDIPIKKLKLNNKMNIKNNENEQTEAITNKNNSLKKTNNNTNDDTTEVKVHNDNSLLVNTSIKSADSVTQCNMPTSVEDAFINSLKHYLQDMNLRQKLQFKKKIFQALIETFEDVTNFPSNSSANTTVTETNPNTFLEKIDPKEMNLMTELVSIVQAAKVTPELNTEPIASKPDEKTAEPKNDTPAKLLVRKPIELRSNGSVFSIPGNTTSKTVLTPTLPCRVLEKMEGEKRRIYRIIPKNSITNQGFAGNITLAASPNKVNTTFISTTGTTSSTTTISTASNSFVTSTVTAYTNNLSAVSSPSATPTTSAVTTGTPPIILGQPTSQLRAVNWVPPSSLATPSTINRTIPARSPLGVSANAKLMNRRFSICDPSMLSKSHSLLAPPVPPLITALPKNNIPCRVLSTSTTSGSPIIPTITGQRARAATLLDNSAFASSVPTVASSNAVQAGNPPLLSFGNGLPTSILQKSPIPIIMAPVRTVPSATATSSVHMATNVRPTTSVQASILKPIAPKSISPKQVNLKTFNTKAVAPPKPVPQKLAAQKPKIMRRKTSRTPVEPEMSDAQEETAGIIMTDELGPWIKNEPLDEMNF